MFDDFKNQTVQLKVILIERTNEFNLHNKILKKKNVNRYKKT